jgi:predicted N-formylglutamate amidohydrolase
MVGRSLPVVPHQLHDWPGERQQHHCSLEVRQDLIDTPETARAWGRRLTSPIGAAVAAVLR